MRLYWIRVGPKQISEKAMAPHSSTLDWKIPWKEGPGRLQSVGLEELDMTERLHFYFSLSCIGEGNGNPLQCSCLENPRDGGAWWAAVYGVAQSRTQLKWLSSSSSSKQIWLDKRKTQGSIVWWESQRLKWCTYKPRNTKDYWQHKKLREGYGFLLEALEKAWPCWHFD